MPGEPVRAEAPAKVNLGLRVRPPDRTGRHPLVSLGQTVDRVDALDGRRADADRLEMDDGQLPEGGENLVWRAVEALRAETGDRRPLALRLAKRIPVSAGLAGGSADAAAGLLVAGALLGVGRATLEELAVGLGADVPFSLHGGFAWMEGHGEKITAIDPVPGDYALAVVVPPFELDTGSVYRAWDGLGGPDGDPVEGRFLPPSLRPYGPIANDLYPAAALLRPELADRRSDLERAWERPVLMTGSGPSLFAFFTDLEEAESSLAAASEDARNRFAVRPVGYGARLVER